MKRQPDTVVEQAIETANLCRAFHVLPRAGGLYDQDSRDVYMMAAVLSAQAEREEMERKQQG